MSYKRQDTILYREIDDIMLYKILLICYFVFTVEISGERCPASEFFNETFISSIEEALGDRPKENVQQMDQTQAEEFWWDVSCILLKKCEAINENKIFDEKKTVKCLIDMHVLQPQDESALSLCYEGCFRIYGYTTEEYKTMIDCFKGVKKVICEMPQNPNSQQIYIQQIDIEQPEATTATTNFGEKNKNFGHHKCKIPDDQYIEAFKSLFKSESEDLLMKEKVDSFFQSITTNDQLHEKLMDGSNSCLENEMGADMQMMCLFKTYSETCEKPDKSSKGKNTNKNKNTNKIKNKNKNTNKNAIKNTNTNKIKNKTRKHKNKHFVIKPDKIKSKFHKKQTFSHKKNK
ncbi:hypothetical protein CHUAL_010528 [Chamberlinius hualienensis]